MIVILHSDYLSYTSLDKNPLTIINYFNISSFGIDYDRLIDNEFNMEVVYNELERHIVGYLDDIGQGFKIIEEELEEELEE